MTKIEAKLIDKAVEEQCRTTTINFAKWISTHGLNFQPATPDGSWIGLNMKNYSSEELDDIYLKTLGE